MKLACVIIFINHLTQVNQVAPFLQTVEITRIRYMKHKITHDTKLQQVQFGFYKKGPLTPLPHDKVKQYGELIAIVYSKFSIIQPQVCGRLEYPDWVICLDCVF